MHFYHNTTKINKCKYLYLIFVIIYIKTSNDLYIYTIQDKVMRFYAVKRIAARLTLPSIYCIILLYNINVRKTKKQQRALKR